MVHTEPPADRQGRGAAESSELKMARGAEGVRNSFWRARCRGTANSPTTRCFHHLSALARNSDYAICPTPSADPACAVRMNKAAPS